MCAETQSSFYEHLWSLQWVWPSTSTSAVGLLGGGLVLWEADSGPLGAGEILRQGHIEDLVVQRVTVCRDTQRQTLLSGRTAFAACLGWTVYEMFAHRPCASVWAPPLLWAGSLRWPSPAWVWPGPLDCLSRREKTSSPPGYWPSAEKDGTHRERQLKVLKIKRI